MSEEKFPASSRYAATERATLQTAKGEPVAYLRRRLLPPHGAQTVLAEHDVVEGDRPDTLAATYLGDPEQYWRLCDANQVMHPRELTEEIGRRVRVTLPAGLGHDD
jgi:hypothetical protein